jgi:Protein of unknown function (DUF3159)
VRLARRESLRAALIGLVIAVVCALVTAITGEARGLFLVPTLLPGGWTLLFLGSVLIGRPRTGVALNRMACWPRNWRHHAFFRFSTSTDAARQRLGHHQQPLPPRGRSDQPARRPTRDGT